MPSAVTAGDEIANEALRLLGKVDLARVSAPRLFVGDLLEIACRLDDEMNARQQAG